MTIPLLIVDMQNGFINDFTRHLAPRVITLIKSGRYDPILFTRFINEPDSPFHRYVGWHACAEEPETLIIPELAGYAEPDRVFTKPGLVGMPDELRAFLEARGDEEVVLVGVDTDMCVLKLAMDIFDLGIRPVVLVDCCASTAGLQSHLAGLAVLARNIGADQLRDAGLSGGRLAAPMDVDQD